MEEVIRELKALYQSRNIPGVDAFVNKWFKEPCVVVGTCVGEICVRLDDIKSLLVNDLKYWYDLLIDGDDVTKEEAAGYVLLHCKGTLSFKINENKQRYRRFAGICDSTINDGALSAMQKAYSIEYTLSALLSSRQRKRRICLKTVAIDIIMKGDKILFVHFALEKDLDHADSFLGFTQTLDDEFLKEKEAMTLDKSKALESAFAAMGYENICLNVLDGRIFFGICTKQATEPLEGRLGRLFKEYKGETDYDSLFRLRLEIAYLMKIYSFGEKPSAFVRFFGILEDAAPKAVHFRYPNDLYIEDR